MKSAGKKIKRKECSRNSFITTTECKHLRFIILFKSNEIKDLFTMILHIKDESLSIFIFYFVGQSYLIK